MSKIKFYPNLKKMIAQTRAPPATVGKYANLNAFFFLALVVFASEVEKSGMTSPDGYASLPVLIGTILLIFIAMLLELAVAMSLVVASRWRLTVPDFLAIGVLKGEENAEEVYRKTLVRFYGGQDINRTVTAATLVVALVSLGWALYDSMILGYAAHDFTLATATITSIVMLGHLIISLVARSKREKWQHLSDEAIRDDIFERFRDYPEDIDEVVPSVEELEELLQQARFSDSEALRTADQLEAFLRTDARRIAVFAIIIGVCTFLILL